jgi:hypothetical protein
VLFRRRILDHPAGVTQFILASEARGRDQGSRVDKGKIKNVASI